MKPSTGTSRLAVLPDTGRELLRAEAALALEALGFAVLRVRPEELDDAKSPHYLPRLAEKRPALFLAINLQGLFPGAARIRPLLEAGCAVLGWFVDNPWHILSAMRDPSWREIRLAVTDASFIPHLRAAGAASVMHLPLAASPAHLRAAGNAPAKLGGIVFAGRSAFPGLDEFFAGQDLAPESLDKAAKLPKSGVAERPDFAWWVRELGLVGQEAGFWPGKKARQPGKGAVLSNRAWRAACLAAAQKYSGGLTVFGDSAWQDLAELRPPVDYYTALPAIYRAAPFSLNINSLLLPAGLSQRIFDAWAAGGFCLTDRNAGLDIFPPELARPVSFNTPDEIPELAARLAADTAGKEALRRDWREHILAGHTYEKRLAAALASLELL